MSEATAAWAACKSGQGCGESGMAGEVGVINGGLGVRGLLGGNPQEVSMMSFCNIL